MMQVDGKKSISDTDLKLCKPCEDDTKRVPANGLCQECEEHMCIACFGNHKKYKMCKDHNMVDIDTKIPDVSDTVEESFDICLIHTKENIKFYCSSHEEIGCGDCMILKHKTCDVQYIRDISNSFKDSKEFNDIVKRVDSCQTEINKCSTSINNNKVQVEDIHQGFLAEVKSFRDEINTHLDKIEEDLVRKANDAKTADTMNIESLGKPCEELEKEITQISDDIVSKSDEPNKLFVTAMQCKSTLNEIEHKLCNVISNTKISNYCFKRNDKIKELLEQTELGTFQVMQEENSSGTHAQEYEVPISSQAQMRSSQIYEDTISIAESQDYEELYFEDIPVRKSSHKRGSTRRTSWSLFENQLRCENLLMAGEFLSFKDNERGDIGLFIGKKAIKTGTYLEVEIISTDQKGNIAVGFVPKEYSLKGQPGDGRFSVGYHANDGCIHDEGTCSKRISPPCRVGDVIGAGVASYLTNVFKTKIEIFFTRNSQKIGTLEVNSPSFCKVYPAVGLQSSGDKARVILDANEPTKITK